MGIEVKLGYHQKRYNSTDQQVNLKYKMSCDAKLKQPCDLVHPTFIIDRNHVNQETRDAWVPNFAELNYCYVKDFLRYYFITQTKYITNDIVEITCDVDTLATRQDLIETLDGYVLYCSDKKHNNTAIDDSRLTPEVPIEIQDKPVFDSPIWDLSSVTYMVTATVLLDQVGVNITWAMDKNNFDNLSLGITNYITGQDSSTIDKAVQWIAKTFGGVGSISDYIKTIVIVPFDYDTYFKPDGEQEVCIANIKFSSAPKIYGVPYREAKLLTDEEDVTLPVDTGESIIPTAATSIGSTNTDMYFLRSSKYYSAGIKHPGGVLYIDTNCFCNKSIAFDIYVFMVVNALNGKYVFEVWAKDTFTFLGSASGTLGIPISLWSGGGTSDVWANALSNVVPTGLDAISGVLNMGTGDSKAQAGSSSENSTDKSSDHKKINLGIFGRFFPGNYSISRGPAVSSGDGWVDLAMANTYIDDEGEVASDNEWAFKVIAKAIIPSVCTSQEDYDAYAALHGYPVSKVLNITDDEIEINNYIQWSNMSCSMSNAVGKCMLPEEVAQLNSMMNSGIFYEGTSGD